VALNVKFHLFQELTNQYSVVIVLDKTNHKIQAMIEVQDIPEMTEVQDVLVIKIHAQEKMILNLKIQKPSNL
jgi:hypothetical protein